MKIVHSFKKLSSGHKFLWIMTVLILSWAFISQYGRKPGELKRNIPLEILRVVHVVQTYDVWYDFEACGVKPYIIARHDRFNYSNYHKSYKQGYTIAALSKKDALKFTRSAFPDCEVTWLYRVKFRLQGKSLDEKRIALICELGGQCPPFAKGYPPAD